MQKIVPHLWFDTQAIEATAFYTSLFPNSKVTHTTKLTGTPSGDCDVVLFELMGMSFQAISAGPYFAFNPSISFMVNFDPTQDPDARARIDVVWEKLLEGGKVLMDIGEYPFSSRYGWVQDKYGLNWQLIYSDVEGEARPAIMPSLLFVGDVVGKAQEAGELYQSVFKDTEKGMIVNYPAGMEPEKEDSVMFSDFRLENMWFTAMDSARMHDFKFNEAVSFIVHCDTQEEIDYFTDKLSAVPEAVQCGWIKDVYGVSWQIVPTMMDEVMTGGDQEKIDRLTKAFLPMKKLDIAELQAALEKE